MRPAVRGRARQHDVGSASAPASPVRRPLSRRIRTRPSATSPSRMISIVMSLRGFSIVPMTLRSPSGIARLVQRVSPAGPTTESSLIGTTRNAGLVHGFEVGARAGAHAARREAVERFGDHDEPRLGEPDGASCRDVEFADALPFDVVRRARHGPPPRAGPRAAQPEQDGGRFPELRRDHGPFPCALVALAVPARPAAADKMSAEHG